jgi:hypothetical protein
VSGAKRLGRRALSDAAREVPVYDREQVQALPQWHVPPQRQPGRRFPTVLFFAI